MKTNTLLIPVLWIFSIGTVLAATPTTSNRPTTSDRPIKRPLLPEKSLEDRLRFEERLRFHGFKEVNALWRFITQLKKAAQTNNKKELVGLVQFPFSIYNAGVVVKTYKNQNELLRQFDTVFSEKVIDAISKCKFESLFVRDQGAMIGNGEVWLFPFKEGIKIKSINP